MQMPLGEMMPLVDNIQKSKTDAKTFFNTGNRLTYLSFRDPARKESVYGGEQVLTIETSAGRKKVSCDTLQEVQASLKLDVICCPAEEVPISKEIGAKRRNRSVIKGAEYLKQMLKAREAGKIDKDCKLLANIQGGSAKELRLRACTEAAETKCDGFMIGGLGYAESPEERDAVLKALELPSDKPRFLPLNRGSPSEVLQAVMYGMDVMEIGYPTECAKKGVALNFSLEAKTQPGTEEEKRERLAGLAGRHGNFSDLDLSNEVVKHVTGPISEDSPVKQYSQAYLYHLIQCKELLAPILLTMHNLDAYNKFFSAIRKHIAAGTFLDFALTFLEQSSPAVEETAEPEAKRRKL